MEHLQKIEEDLGNIGSDAKKKYPEVKAAADNALTTLKLIREMYVSKRMNNKADTAAKLPQVRPYLYGS